MVEYRNTKKNSKFLFLYLHIFCISRMEIASAFYLIFIFYLPLVKMTENLTDVNQIDWDFILGR